MRNLKAKDIKRFHKAIWPGAPVTISGEISIDGGQMAIDQTWEICDWADLYGFDSQPLRTKVTNYLASFNLEPKAPLKVFAIKILHGDQFESIKARIDDIYGWGSDYSSDQADLIPAPVTVPIKSSRNDGVIDICMSALVRSGIVPSDDMYQLSRYWLMLSQAFSQHLAVLWCPEDIAYALNVEDSEVDPSLVNDVFNLVNKNHDAEIGVNWDVIRCCAQQAVET